MRFLLIALGVLVLASCQSFEGPLPPQPQPQTPVPPGSPQPQESPVQQPPEQPQPSQPQKHFKLGAASSALVSQAQKQAKGGDSVAATATLERALRIEPDNPLLWIELGRLRLQERNAPQAQSLGRKALALATGDPRTQSSAWQLIGEALRAQGRNQEAADAERRANELATAPLSDSHEAFPDDEFESEEEAWSEVIEV